MDSQFTPPGVAAVTPRAWDQANGTERAGGSWAFGTAAPKIELLKGGGVIHGIGEKFAANPLAGTGSVSLPIGTSPDGSGFGPQLSLSDDYCAYNAPGTGGERARGPCPLPPRNPGV